MDESLFKYVPRHRPPFRVVLLAIAAFAVIIEVLR